MSSKEQAAGPSGLGLIGKADDPKRLMEAALFISAGPLSIQQLAKVCNLGTLGSVRSTVEDLQEEYEESGSAIVIEKVSSGYRMMVDEELEEKIKHLAPDKEISSSALKTLAIIAYEEPVRQSEVVKVRGNKAYRYIKELEEREFVNSEKDGRTKLLSTTKKFKEYFQLEDIEKALEERKTSEKENSLESWV